MDVGLGFCDVPGDVRALRASGAPIAGKILGRALYDGDIDAGEAVRAAGLREQRAICMK